MTMQRYLRNLSLHFFASLLLGVSAVRAAEVKREIHESDVRIIIEDLHSTNREAASRAIKELELFGPDQAQFVKLLGTELKRECANESVYSGAGALATAIGNFGDKGDSAVGVLLQCSINAHTSTPYQMALNKIAKTVAGVPPAVTEALDSKDFHTRSAGIQFVSAMGPSGKSAVPQILKILNDPRLSLMKDFDLRGNAMWALGNIGPEAKAGVPVMLQMFGQKNINKRMVAISLGNIGPAAEEAVPILRSALVDPDEALRIFSARALVKIGTPDALDAVKVYTQKGGRM